MKQIAGVLVDKIGIFLSLLCAIHCALTPVIILAVPALSHYFSSVAFHIAMLAFILPLAIYAFSKQKKVHGEETPMKFGMSGLFLITAGVLVGIQVALETGHHEHTGFEHMHVIVESVLTISGSALLVYGHWLNMKLCACKKKVLAV